MHKTRSLRWTQKVIRLSRIAEPAGSPQCGPEPACFEPATLEGRFQTARLSRREQPGGADRDRTDDLRLAKPALSQLSYSPPENALSVELVGLDGFEPSTSRLSGGRSNQLSYRPLA